MPSRCSFQRAAAFGAAMCLLMVAAEPTRAIGYYNLPGSFCQSFGYGYGAGYHACLVLGPVSCRGFCATNEVRLECPPQPPYGYDGCAHGQCGAMSRATSLEAPTLEQPAAPQPAPAPTAKRPPILRRPQIW